MKILNKETLSWRPPLILFLLAFFCLPVYQLKWLSMMPGGLGDARLNNYFLENIYRFFIGQSDSLWRLGFFHPFPYVGGFSDNLFGASPVYLLARFVKLPSDTAFQIWFLFSYVANYVAAYYVFRRFQCCNLAASVGALIFAFALPTTSHVSHAQLCYRFGVPLFILFFVYFIEQKNWRYLTVSAAWLVWQLYCSIYIGFFGLLLSVLILTGYIFLIKYAKGIRFIEFIKEFIKSWMAQTSFEKTRFWVISFSLFGLLVLLFYPYYQVKSLYGFERSWDEISTMLPRPQSYIFSNVSLLWRMPASTLFANIPMRHEHQMFFGLIPMLLALYACFTRDGSKREIKPLMLWAFGGAVVLTLYIGGASLWYFLHGAPLFSAIRAMTRIDLALLFPISCLCAIAIDRIYACKNRLSTFALMLIVSLLICEFSAVTMPSSTKQSWREALLSFEANVPGDLPDDPVLFFAQKDLPWFTSELNSMWVAFNRGVKTLNGYSGSIPPGFTVEYGDDCSELTNRVDAYLDFSKDKLGKTYSIGERDDLLGRIVPIGFEKCDKQRATGAQPSDIQQRSGENSDE